MGPTGCHKSIISSNSEHLLQLVLQNMTTILTYTSRSRLCAHCFAHLLQTRDWFAYASQKVHIYMYVSMYMYLYVYLVCAFKTHRLVYSLLGSFPIFFFVINNLKIYCLLQTMYMFIHLAKRFYRVLHDFENQISLIQMHSEAKA